MSNEQAQSQDYPPMVGTGQLEATQEIHIFLLPLNPSDEILAKYYAAVNEWNDVVFPALRDAGVKTEKMKACHLALIFRKDGQEQEVRVMQSARYLRSNDPSLVIQHCHRDAEWFKEKGLEVVREKIEASAYGIQGIPQTDEEAQKYPKYFEFHIKVRRKDREDSSPITDDEIGQLKTVAVKFSQQYQVPVPLSFNKNKDKTNADGQGHQRFLNLRFRKMGIETIRPKVKAVEESIKSDTSFDVVKAISEYVWYDTYNEMDHGWIDFSPEEFQQAYLTE